MQAIIKGLSALFYHIISYIKFNSLKNIFSTHSKGAKLNTTKDT